MRIGVVGAKDRYDHQRHSDYLDVEECAVQMNLTAGAVRDLARRGVLRSLDMGMGVLIVQPAILSGAT